MNNNFQGAVKRLVCAEIENKIRNMNELAFPGKEYYY